MTKSNIIPGTFYTKIKHFLEEKVVKRFVKLWYSILIENMQGNEVIQNLIKDIATSAAVATYDPIQLERVGLRLSSNTSQSKTQFFGLPGNPIYPEIIIWKPDYDGAGTGKAALVEFVEIPETIENSINKFRTANLFGIPFNIIVPSRFGSEAVEILKKYNIVAKDVYEFSYDEKQKRHIFTKVI